MSITFARSEYLIQRRCDKAWKMGFEKRQAETDEFQRSYKAKDMCDYFNTFSKATRSNPFRKPKKSYGKSWSSWAAWYRGYRCAMAWERGRGAYFTQLCKGIVQSNPHKKPPQCVLDGDKLCTIWQWWWEGWSNCYDSEEFEGMDHVTGEEIEWLYGPHSTITQKEFNQLQKELDKREKDMPRDPWNPPWSVGINGTSF